MKYLYGGKLIKGGKMSDIKWKTMNGELLEFSEMTDLHIENAIKYCEKREITSIQDKENNIKSLYYLKEEKERRRIQKKKDGARKKCPFCKKGIMELVEEKYEDPYPDVGFGLVEYFNYLKCPNCGATGPEKKERI